MIALDLKTKNQLQVAGFVLIKCIPGYEKRVFSRLKVMGNEIEIDRVNLSYDILIKVLSKTHEEFREKIKEIRKIPNIMTSTILYANYRQ